MISLPSLDDVKIRPINADDLPELAAWRNQDHVRKWFFDSRIITAENQERWFQSYLKKDDDQMFVIEADGIGIGTAAIYGIDNENRSAEIGRFIIGRPDCHAKGYAYAGGRHLIDYAFQELKMERLYLYLLVENERAFKLYRRLGFASEGVMRKHRLTDSGRQDIMVMGLLADEYSLAMES